LKRTGDNRIPKFALLYKSNVYSDTMRPSKNDTEIRMGLSLISEGYKMKFQ